MDDRLSVFACIICARARRRGLDGAGLRAHPLRHLVENFRLHLTSELLDDARLLLLVPGRVRVVAGVRGERRGDGGPARVVHLRRAALQARQHGSRRLKRLRVLGDAARAPRVFVAHSRRRDAEAVKPKREANGPS